MKLSLLFLFFGTSVFANTVMVGGNGIFSAGVFPANEALDVRATGEINLLGLSGGHYFTAPSGALAEPIPNTGFWDALYQYAVEGHAFPGILGGDDINHFAGGGTNFDVFNDPEWGQIGAHTTDTTDPTAVRLGTLLYTFDESWQVLGFGGALNTGGGGELRFQVEDTDRTNNTGFYTVSVGVGSQVPEPGGLLLLGGLLPLYFIGGRWLKRFLN